MFKNIVVKTVVYPEIHLCNKFITIHLYNIQRKARYGVWCSVYESKESICLYLEVKGLLLMVGYIYSIYNLLKTTRYINNKSMKH